MNHCVCPTSAPTTYYHTQDTFSFALVLLCLAVGDILFVRKQGGIIATTAYFSGWRPTLSKTLRAGSPEIAALIEQMWLADFRARPAMRDVVVRLEACTVVDRSADKSEAHPEEHSTSSQVDDQTDDTGLDRQSGDPAVSTIATLRAENEAAKAEIEDLKAALAQANAQLEMETPERFLGVVQENDRLREENERLELNRAYAEARPAGPGEEKADRPPKGDSA